MAYTFKIPRDIYSSWDQNIMRLMYPKIFENGSVEFPLAVLFPKGQADEFPSQTSTLQKRLKQD